MSTPKLTRKLWTVTVIVLWCAILVTLGAAAWRHHLTRKQDLYELVWMVALAWFFTAMWATLRQAAVPNRQGRLRSSLARAGDRIAPIVAKAEKKLFLWTPLLSAVFWSLFGSSLQASIHAGRSPLEPQRPVFMYFMLAMVSINLLLKGLAELRHPPEGHIAQRLRQ